MIEHRKIISVLIIISAVISLSGQSFAARPTRSIMTAGIYVDVGKSGDRFVAANRWGIELFDVDREGNITSISTIHTSGRAEFLDVKEDLIVVSNFTGSLELFRIEDNKFEPITWLRLEFHPLEIKIAGEYLYVGGAEKSLVTFDISDPANPVRVSETIFDGYPHDYKIRNDSMFVAAYHGGVVILDISDGANPVLIEQYYMPDFVYGVDIDSSYVYVSAHQSGLYVLDLRFNSRPPILGHNPDFGSARETAFVDGGLLALDGFGALKLIDLRYRSIPETIWSMPLDFNCYNIAIDNDIAFLANWIYGVKTIRLNGKNEPWIEAEKTMYSVCKSLAVNNGRVLAATGKGGLMTLDRDLKPSATPALEIEGSCIEIKISGDRGFVSTDDYGLNLLDLNDGGEIVNISALKTNGWVRSSSFDGQYAFLANWQGIVTVDLQDMNFPNERGFYDTQFGSSKIEYRGDTVLVAGSGGLELYDASDPQNVSFLSRFSTEYPAVNLSLDNDLIVLSSGLGGVDFISLIGEPTLVTHIPTEGKAYDANVIGTRLFVAEEDSGITVWDISVINQPEYSLRFDVAGKAYDMAFDGNRIYVADYYGITMLELPWQDVFEDDSDQDPGPNIYLELYPNPVVEKSTVRLDISTPGMINIELFDILGRKVKTLYDGYTRGSSVVSLDKKNLPSGCYYVRVRGKDFSESRQVTLLK
ncbi:MAG: T9SS type A sorting domain-containing protein [candidate division Zixibacteria bacterium]